MSDYRKDAAENLSASDRAIDSGSYDKAAACAQQAIAYALLDLGEALGHLMETGNNATEALQGIDLGVTAVARVMER